MGLDPAMQQQLIAAAKSASANAYCPYSNFPVGASMLLGDGQIIAGCNVENASYGLAMCAERTAIFRALAQGKGLTEVVAMAIYTPGQKTYTSCGACRQVMSEHLQDSVSVISACDADAIFEWTMGDALPKAFRLKD